MTSADVARGGGRTARATLATIAASAGVSVATVSKVLNDRADVAPATRALVQEILQQHNYVATASRRREPPVGPTVELSFDHSIGVYALELINGVVDAGRQHGVSIAVSRRDDDVIHGSPTAWVRSLVEGGRRGLIAVIGELTEAQVGALTRAHLPLVVIDPLSQLRSELTSVGATNFAGGLSAAQHLLALGHRRIAYLGGHAQAGCYQARMHGYLAAMQAAGVGVPPEYVITEHNDFEDGVAGGLALLDLPEPPTAVFAGNDVLALGVIEAARTRGLRIPQDISVVGFDDNEAAHMASPPLTTVRQPLREIGQVALRTVLRLAADERLDAHHVELATELVVRQSTAPPPVR